MEATEMAKRVDEKFPALAKEIEKIVLTEEDIDTQLVKLKCLLLLAIAAERKRAKQQG